MWARLLTAATGLSAVAAALGACDDDSGRRPQPPALPPVDRSLFDYDPGRPLEVRSEVLATKRGGELEEVVFTSFDGRRVPALLAHPADVRRGPCIVCQAGYRGTKESAIPFWGPLAARGITTLSIDTRFDVRAARDPQRLYQALVGTVIDLRRAIDFLARRPECDAQRIGYLGASLGGFAGTMLTAVDARVVAAGLLVTGGKWSAILRETRLLLPRLERQGPAFRRVLRLLAPLDPARWIGHISPRPVLMINGTRDTTIGPEAARALRRAAREPKRYDRYPGGHGQYLGRQDVAAVLDEWVLENIVRAGPVRGGS